MEIVKKIIQENKGFIKPLLIPAEYMIGPSISNPSIFNFNGIILVNLRNLNYILYHSEKNLHEHIWGPLLYVHPEDDQTLTTHNIFCELTDDLSIKKYSRIDTSKLDVEPIWEFVGLEDGRIVIWENKLFLTGVRRDTTPNGIGRMELSQLSIEDGHHVKEIHRERIPAPSPDTTYCEKNWMPILDRPYHFVKWTNPTEVVKYCPESKTTETVSLTPYQNFNTSDLRGGSQVIRYQDKYLAVLHEVALYSSPLKKKDGSYFHSFCLWDENFNLIKVSPRFNFLGAKIEFTCGLCEKNDDFLITFGFQDNAAFVLSVKKDFIMDFIHE